jgi:HK97 family phage portal protein
VVAVILGGAGGDVSIAQLRDVTQSSAYRAGSGLGRIDALSGQIVDREAAMGLPPFWSGVMLLAKTAGTLPLEVRDETKSNQVVRGAGVALRLRAQWNSETPAAVALTTLFTHLIPTHNAFVLKLPASDGLAAPELFLIEPELVEKYRGPDRELRYDLYTREGGSFASGVHGRHIIHFRGPGVHGTFRPESMISMARNSLGNALATQEYQGAMYRNGGVPKGVLSVDEPLTLEQGLEMADAWRAAYGGSENAGKIAVLDRGGKFQTVGMTNENAQFIEQLQLSATDAARLLNIPPAFIGAEGSAMTYDNASSNNRHLLTYALRPWLDLVEGALNMDDELFGVRSPWVPRFNTDEITRPDQEARYAGYASAIQAGWMTVGDAREFEGLPPLKAGVVATVEPGNAAAGGMDAANRSLGDSQARSFDGLTVNVNQAPVHVAPADVRVDAQPVQVDLHVPEQRELPAPVVNVHVPEQPAPVVNVAAPDVRVDVAAPSVQVDAPITVKPTPVAQGEKKIAFTRNKLGNIIDAKITEG